MSSQRSTKESLTVGPYLCEFLLPLDLRGYDQTSHCLSPTPVRSLRLFWGFNNGKLSSIVFPDTEKLSIAIV